MTKNTNDLASLNDNFYSHSIKMYIGSSNIMCFEALIELSSPKNLIIKNIPVFGKDSLYTELFYKIIDGKIKAKYVDKEKKTYNIKIDEGDALSNFEKYIDLQAKYFSTKIKLDEVANVNHFGLRFDGAPYNLKYSIPRKVGKRFERISDCVIKILEDETESDEFYLSEPIAASTMIRYANQKIDKSIESIVNQLSNDIKLKKIDYNLIKKDNKESKIYRKIINALKPLNSIEELDIFEIHVNDKFYSITDFKFLKNIDTNLFDKPINKKGVKQGFELINNGSIGSLKLKMNDEIVRLHIKIDKESKTMFNRANREPIGTTFKFRALQCTTETYDCQMLRKVN
ncbi:hypothetical protein OAR97_00610 [Arcobacteraceae bacterium]|nr:hypothetical protein [Arcobacteraceae bacterium]